MSRARKSEATTPGDSPSPSTKRFLTVAEVAAELSIPLSTVYAHIAKGKIPGHRFHTLVRVKREDLDQFIEASRIQPPKRRGRKLKDYSAFNEAVLSGRIPPKE